MTFGYEARNGDEQDVCSKYWRRALTGLSRPGITSRIKRQMRRRGRHFAKQYLDNSAGVG